MLMIRWAIVVAGVFCFFSLIYLIKILLAKTCLLRHRQRRYLAMDLHGSNNASGVMVPRCRCWAPDDQTYSDYHRFLMRWFCDACGSMGEHCWDKKGEWKLEHGQIVPDEKRWANRA